MIVTDAPDTRYSYEVEGQKVPMQRKACASFFFMHALCFSFLCMKKKEAHACCCFYVVKTKEEEY